MPTHFLVSTPRTRPTRSALRIAARLAPVLVTVLLVTSVSAPAEAWPFGWGRSHRKHLTQIQINARDGADRERRALRWLKFKYFWTRPFLITWVTHPTVLTSDGAKAYDPRSGSYRIFDVAAISRIRGGVIKLFEISSPGEFARAEKDAFARKAVQRQHWEGIRARGKKYRNPRIREKYKDLFIKDDDGKVHLICAGPLRHTGIVDVPWK